MINQDEFLITEKVKFEIENNPEIYLLHMNLFKDIDNNPLLKWTYYTLEKYENLMVILALQERTQEFTINAYYHLQHVISDYEITGLNWNSSLELAQDDLKKLFSKYNLKKIKV